jgi:hypothetical protein
MKVVLKKSIVFLITFCSLAGCAIEQLGAPSLNEVCLADQRDNCINAVYPGAAYDLALLGEQFQPAYLISLDNTQAPETRAHFMGKVGHVVISPLTLQPELLRDAQVLHGRLEGNLPVGLHSAEVVTPAGQHALLADALRVTNPLRVNGRTHEPQAPAGYPFHLEVDLENLGPVDIQDSSITLSQQGSGSCELPQTPEVFTIPAGQAVVRQIELAAVNPGKVTLGLSVSGVVNQTVFIELEQPLAIEARVLTPTDLQAVASLDQPSARLGHFFELIVDVTNLGQTPALGVELLIPNQSGPGTVSWEAPKPEALDIPAGSTRRIRWEGRATNTGAVEISARISGMEAISGRLLGPIGTNLLELQIIP